MHPDKFTIIIPTRDRADTLEHALRTVTMQDYNRLEIVVSDNFSQDETRKVVEANADSRIVYVNTGRRLSMTHNWEFALARASGDWIGFIGDDDGLLPGSITAASAIAKETGVELIRSRSAFYQWPSIGGHGSGILTVPIGGQSGVREAGSVLRRVIDGRLDYQNLPTIYNGGFVHRRAIDRSRAADGSFFQSQIPDLYSSIVLSALTDRFFWSGRPFAINGASRHSTGTSYFSESSDAEAQRAARLFAAEPNIPLHPRVPSNDDGSIPRSIQALLYESYLQAQRHHPNLPPVDPRAQLRAIMHAAGSHERQIESWAAKFADTNAIDMISPSPSARQVRKVRRALARVYMNRMMFPAKDGPPIPNVYCASRVAGVALENPPTLPIALVRNVVERAITILSLS